VNADGLLADEQEIPDLAVGAAVDQEAEYFRLTLGQAEPPQELGWG
jgi:hypothetical protein